MSVVYIFANELLVRIFTAEPAVVAAGAQCLRIVAYGYIAYAWGMVMLRPSTARATH
jgi:Na+-driven multidrug efflux pump